MPFASKCLVFVAGVWLTSARLEVVLAAPPEPEDAIAASDARLRSRLYSEYPELRPNGSNDRRLDDWDRIVRLREFSYRHTGYANNVDSESYRAGTSVVDEVIKGKKSLDEAYSFFDAGNGGVVCGGTAAIFCELCRWAGYDAWSLNFGFYPAGPSGVAFTHVVVLVRIPVIDGHGEKKEIISVHDPSVNRSYTHADGTTPLDYFEMLAKLKFRKASEVGYSGAVDPAARRADPITVAFPDETKGITPQDLSGSWNIGEPFTWSIGPQRQWIFRAPRMSQDFERLGEVLWKPELVRRGMPKETIYLHCLPFQITGPGGDALLARARQVLAANE